MTIKTPIRLALSILVLSLVLACQAEPTEPSSRSTGSISAAEFLSSPPANALVLDVRTPAEFAGGHVANALNVPHDQLASRLSELSGGPDRPVVVYCESGKRAGMAATTLADAGFSNVIHLEGDMRGWREAGRPLQTP